MDRIGPPAREGRERLRVLLAPSGFKESLDVHEVAVGHGRQVLYRRRTR